MKDDFFDGNLPETEENGKITCEEVSSIQQKDNEILQSQPCDEVIFDVAHEGKPEKENHKPYKKNNYYGYVFRFILFALFHRSLLFASLYVCPLA